MEMTDDDKDILDINIFIKLLKTIQDLKNFESYKTPFLFSPHFFKR